MTDKFISLSHSMIRRKDLTMQEKIVYLEILNLSSLDKGCIASNKHFEVSFGISKKSVSNTISSLVSKGFITSKLTDRNNTRVLSIKDGGVSIKDGGVSIKDGESKENKQVNIKFNKKKKEQKENLPHQTSSNTQNHTSSENNDDYLEIEEFEVLDEITDVQEIQLSKTYDEAKEVADYLLAKILNFNSTFKKENKSWIRDIELAIRLDGRDKKSLINCIDWMYSSDKGRFWIANVLSGKKLRDKFDTMNTQAMSFTGTNGLGYDVNKFVNDLCGNNGGVK
jgi:hypothetical protein